MGATGTMGCGGITMGGGGLGGQALWWTRQHHAFLSSAHVFSGSTAQLNGSPVGTGRVGRGLGGEVGLGGGAVGGGVGGGVGGAVGVVAGNAVVAHPIPVVMQQYCCCSSDHISFQFATPCVQSKGRDVVKRPDSSHQSRRRSRGSRQHAVMMQVKSRLCLMTSKSPPYPTYLYVVS